METVTKTKEESSAVVSWPAIAIIRMPENDEVIALTRGVIRGGKSSRGMRKGRFYNEDPACSVTKHHLL